MVVMAAGCAAEAVGPVCYVHADCASGRCLPGGTCATESGQDGGTDAGLDIHYGDAGASSGATVDAGGSGAPDAGNPGGDGGSYSCKPDHNGAVERDEVYFAAAQKARFRVASGVTFATAGAARKDGTKLWDMAAKLEGDQDMDVETLAIAGKWFAGDYPGATYAARMTAGSDLLGVFRATDVDLQLLGVVSADDGLFMTRLHYDPPIPVLRFPLMQGATWQTKSKVTGTAQGVFAAYAEHYTSKVDARGALKTPFGNFPVLRVHTRLERTIGLLQTVLQSHFFVAECYGTVAAVRSHDGETQADFTAAAEVRRWAP